MAEKPKRPFCGNCGGTKVMHSTPAAVSLTLAEDEGCWCPRCLAKPVEARCRDWTVGEKPKQAPLDKPVARVGHKHPETAQIAAQVARLKAGTRRKEVFDLISRAGERGMTDDELEQVTGRSHQSMSAVRNSLMNDGLLVDGGLRRRTKWGQQAICWVVATVENQGSNMMLNS